VFLLCLWPKTYSLTLALMNPEEPNPRSTQWTWVIYRRVGTRTISKALPDFLAQCSSICDLNMCTYIYEETVFRHWSIANLQLWKTIMNYSALTEAKTQPKRKYCCTSMTPTVGITKLRWKVQQSLSYPLGCFTWSMNWLAEKSHRGKGR
jgi:hypothetical protein